LKKPRLTLTIATAAVLVAVAVVFATVSAKPADAFPNKTTACTSCHSGTPSGTVTAVPSTTSPATGAAYTVAIDIGLSSSGQTGYRIVNADAATPAVAVIDGPAAQTSWTASMTAPAAPGTYSYKVWTVKGPADNTGQATSVTYSITVPAATATAHVMSLTPTHAKVGDSVTIGGHEFGAGGVVTFGGQTAVTTSWSATSIVATVPSGISGSVNVVVTPSGGSASNAVAFTVDATPGPDTTAPTVTATGATDMGWYKALVSITLTATDNAGGSGVASITYALDGGAPQTVTGAGTTVGVPAAGAPDGAHTLTYSATDVAGNAGTPQTLTVNLDTVKPTTKALAAVSVVKGKTATLKCEVDDAAPNGGTAKVTVKILNKTGKVVATVRAGTKAVGAPFPVKYKATLAKGTYKYAVYATDKAGNKQATVGKAKLVIK